MRLNFILKSLFFSSCFVIAIIAVYMHKTAPNPKIISLFPIENYSQNISAWINPTNSDYDQALLTSALQKKRMSEWFDYYFGRFSPWNEQFIQKILVTNDSKNIKEEIQQKLQFYSNQNKSHNEIGYGANFRPYTHQWISEIEKNINLQQFAHNTYDKSKRAIAITNIQGRQLPTHEVHFYRYDIAGEGYPFDNLQATVIWAGTPLYVLGKTLNQDWSLVLTPSFIAWVKTTEIAFTNDQFITDWITKAKSQLIAISKTDIPIQDTENHLFRFSGYIGMALPGEQKKDQIEILIPVTDIQQQAHIHHALLSNQQAILMPFLPTPHHFALIFNELIGRPYGWGGMYFYNDCASELKNLFTIFGIYLPIHSSNQVSEQQYRIKEEDLSNLTLKDRLDYLKKYGHKFMTIVHIGGHVFLYVGSYPNPHQPSQKIVLSYQTMWGLRPKTTSHTLDRRAIVGKTVLFPILESYPEDKNLASHADKNVFQVAFLDEVPAELNGSIHSDLDVLFSP